MDKEGTPTNVIKPKLERDRGGNEASENKARVMYSIFNAISIDEFHRISTCSLAKEAYVGILDLSNENNTNFLKIDL